MIRALLGHTKRDREIGNKFLEILVQWLSDLHNSTLSDPAKSEVFDIALYVMLNQYDTETIKNVTEDILNRRMSFN